MSTFKALNLIEDEDSEDEIDTRELQIEEALKLYQDAIKLHSQGPAFLEEAAKAYVALFASEIFQHTNTLLDWQLAGGAEGDDDKEYASNDTADGACSDSASAVRAPLDQAPNPLQQIRHLAYKNRGLFVLDSLKHSLGRDSAGVTSPVSATPLSAQAPIGSAQSALRDFSQALLSDGTDSSLWRRTARLAEFLESKRLARYCLEAAIDTDVAGAVGRYDSHSLTLEGAYACEQLRQLLEGLYDEISLKRPPINHINHRKLVPQLKKNLDPYPFLQSTSNDDPNSLVTLQRSSSPVRCAITASAPNWTALGKELLRNLVGLEEGNLDISPGSCVLIKIRDGTGWQEPASQTSLKSIPASQTHLAPGTVRQSAAPATHELGTREEGATDAQLGDSLRVDDPDTKETHENHTDNNEESARLSGRKRTSSVAGLHDIGDGGRLRSKRIKARESVGEIGTPGDKLAINITRGAEQQLHEYATADNVLFRTFAELLHTIGVDFPENLDAIYEIIDKYRDINTQHNEDLDDSIGSFNVAASDLYWTVRFWSDTKDKSMLHDGNTAVKGVKEGAAGDDAPPLSLFGTFLEQLKTGDRPERTKGVQPPDRGFARFVNEVNNQWLSLIEVAYRWLRSLLSPEVIKTEAGSSLGSDKSVSSYSQDVWPDNLKVVVANVALAIDNVLYERLSSACMNVMTRQARSTKYTGNELIVESDSAIIEMVETMFELHIDILARVLQPSSKSAPVLRIAQKDRVDRWSMLIDDLMWYYARSHTSSLRYETFYHRYLWASATLIGLSEGTTREFHILCMSDLKTLLQAVGEPVIELPNNAAMPEISVAAAEREISKLAAMDFFQEMFQTHADDPVSLIERLEPIVDPCSINTVKPCSPHLAGEDSQQQSIRQGEDCNLIENHQHENKKLVNSIQLARKFLNERSLMLRLFFWNTLSEAYEAIQYSTKVLSCILQSIELMVSEIMSQSHINTSTSERQPTLLKWMQEIDRKMASALFIVINDASAYDCIDCNHLQSSAAAVAKVARLIHVFTHFEDAVRVGRIPLNAQDPQALGPTPYCLADKLHDMQIRAWTLLYTLLREVSVQRPEAFPNTSEDLARCLRSIHQAFGLRKYCGASNKIFLRFMQRELLTRLTVAEDRERDMLQLLLDLNDLKVGPGSASLQDHGCSHEPPSRRAVRHLISFIVSVLRKAPLKDLSKPEYKSTIDRIQQLMGSGKRTWQVVTNSEVFEIFMQSSIHPRDLYRCLKGLYELPAVQVPAIASVTANSGWYLLLGQMNLSRFRSQKRTSPGPKDELDLATHFFTLDLYHNMERWESWYGQALVYDSMIDDDVTWSADKMNNVRNDLITLQRRSIHCYTMAVSTAFRTADSSFEMVEKMSELFADFGNRIYASSRSPFGMEAFSLDSFCRYFQRDLCNKEPPHPQLSEYNAWKFANVLFGKALLDRPKSWKNHYMRGKCLWKMFNHPDNANSNSPAVGVHNVVQAFVRAIDTLPKRKSDKQEPIFEPHYKLVSVAHKMVQRQLLQVEQACEILEATPYAQKVPPAHDIDSWEPFILQTLKVLRTADKANWHHRMTARAAHIIYDDSPNELFAAVGARHELSQQIFTKTMSIQVWKPEFERPGRHFVYTSRYTKFFARLLLQVNDRAGMEALAKRVRKRSQDFFRHADVWETVCSAYVTLLRKASQIQEGFEEGVMRAIDSEEFQSNISKLKKWTEQPSSSHPSLDILREAVELKRLNGTLSKLATLDDLVADTFAYIYAAMVPDLIEAEKVQEQAQKEEKERQKKDMMSLNNLLMSTDGPSDSPLHSMGTNREPISSIKSSSKIRIKLVTRREVLRAAETFITKLAPPPRHPSPPAPAGYVPPSGCRASRPTELITPITPLQRIHSAASSPGSEINQTNDAKDDITPAVVDSQPGSPGSGLLSSAVPSSPVHSSPGKADEDDNGNGTIGNNTEEEAEEEEVEEGQDDDEDEEVGESPRQPMFPNLGVAAETRQGEEKEDSEMEDSSS